MRLVSFVPPFLPFHKIGKGKRPRKVENVKFIDLLSNYFILPWECGII